MDSDDEAYILLLLSDSSLPTGSFVASSGFESYVKHGFSSTSGSTTTIFAHDSLMTYGRSALPFVSDAHRVVSQFAASVDGRSSAAEDVEGIDQALKDLTALDALYHTMTLNHVARRASKSQGVALLTLYSKGFSPPSSISDVHPDPSYRSTRLSNLLDRYKLLVRKEQVHGHLPICWGALTGALGLSLGLQNSALSAGQGLTLRSQNARNSFTFFYMLEVLSPLLSVSIPLGRIMHNNF